MYVCMSMYACLCMYVYVCMSMYACLCMYVCMYICMYVCMCVYNHLHDLTGNMGGSQTSLPLRVSDLFILRRVNIPSKTIATVTNVAATPTLTITSTTIIATTFATTTTSQQQQH